MTRWQQQCGIILYWLAWPGLWLYLHSSQRTRVLVVCDQQVLLVKTWLGDGTWSLPGGGLHRNEAARDAAQRELAEETTLNLPVEKFNFIASQTTSQHGLSFDYDLYAVEVAAQMPVERQPREIAAIGWFDYRQLRDEQLTPDARAALRTWFNK